MTVNKKVIKMMIPTLSAVLITEICVQVSRNWAHFHTNKKCNYFVCTFKSDLISAENESLSKVVSVFMILKEGKHTLLSRFP